MIYVDTRAGSGPFAPALAKLGLPVQPALMRAGDVAFDGDGPEGRERIGVELKHLSDLLPSLANGRLVGIQVPEMQRAYTRCYLLVVGTWRAGADGDLEQPMRRGWRSAGFGARRWTYQSFVRAQCSLQQAGFAIWRAPTKTEAVQLLAGLYAWWQTPWTAHTTGKAFYQPPPPRVLYTRPSPVRELAKDIPEVGWTLSTACEAMFRSPAEMVTAPACIWAELRPEGLTRRGNRRPKIGAVRAARIVAWLHGRTP